MEKSNDSAAQRWWRTVPDDFTMTQAQGSLDAFGARKSDSRVRRRDGIKTTVGELACAEALLLAPLPPAFPATVTVTRVVSSQALVAFRGNSYSVPPGLAGSTLTLTHRLAEQTLDVGTASGTVLARHRREPDGAGVMVHDTVHVIALETAVLAAFTTDKPCHRKARRPPTSAAMAEAGHLRSNGRIGHHDDEVVVDLARWAAAAEDRRVAP